MDLDHDQSVT
jgi:hypothetical protein